MNPRTLVLTLGLLASAGILDAQSPAPASPADNPAPAGNTGSNQNPVVLSPFTVQAEDSNVYTLPQAVGATRLAANIADLPFTINTITNTFLNDIGAVDLGDGLTYLNVQNDRTQPFSSNISSSYYVRGLPADILMNGFPAASGFTPSARVAIDHAEVLDGPASLLYGAADAGGVINIVTKQATDDSHAGVDATMGDYGFESTTLDVGGRLTPGGLVDYRVLFSGTQAGSNYVDAGSDRVEYVGMLKFNFNPATTLTVEYNFVNNHTAAIPENLLYIITLAAAKNPTGQGAIDYYDPALDSWDANTRGPGNDSIGTSNYFNSELQHRFNDIWNLRVAYAGIDQWSSRKTRAAVIQYTPNPATLSSGTDTWATTDQISNYLQADLAGKWDFKVMSLTSLFGAQYDRTTDSSQNLNSTTGILQNPINPATWGIPVSPVADFNVLAAQSSGYSSDQALYATEQLGFLHDRLLALVGGRWQRAVAESTNELTDTPGYFNIWHNTYQAGLVGKVLKNHGAMDYLNVYTSWSESFVPQNQTLTTAKAGDSTGTPLPGATNGSAPALPITGAGNDAGIKAGFWDGQLTASTDYFNDERDNIISSLQLRNSAGTILDLYSVQAGEERTQGWEGNLSADLFHSSLDLMVNWTHFVWAQLVNYEGTPAYAGKDIANAPSEELSFVAKYTRRKGLLKGVFIGVDGQKSSGFELYADASAQVAFTQGYFLSNAFAGYQWKMGRYRYHAQVNVYNLQDKEYVLGQYQESLPRDFRVTLGVDF